MISGLYCKKKELVVSFQECYECAKSNFECNIIPEFVKFITPDEEDINPELTITKVLHCERRAYLLAKTDYIVSPEDLFSMMRGTAGHFLLEREKVENCIVETRFEKIWNGIKISGKPDKIDIENKTIYDYKTIAGKIGDDRTLRWGNPHLHDQIQLNLYKWLIEDKFEIKRLVLVYIGSDAIMKFPIKIRTPDQKNLWKPMEMAFERIKTLGRVWDKPYSDEIAKTLKAEKSWICRYCFVREKCETL